MNECVSDLIGHVADLDAVRRIVGSEGPEEAPETFDVVANEALIGVDPKHERGVAAALEDLISGPGEVVAPLDLGDVRAVGPGDRNGFVDRSSVCDLDAVHHSFERCEGVANHCFLVSNDHGGHEQWWVGCSGWSQSLLALRGVGKVAVRWDHERP